MVSNVDGQKNLMRNARKKMLDDATHREKKHDSHLFFSDPQLFLGGERGQSFVFIEKHVLRGNFFSVSRFRQLKKQLDSHLFFSDPQHLLLSRGVRTLSW